ETAPPKEVSVWVLWFLLNSALVSVAVPRLRMAPPSDTAVFEVNFVPVTVSFPELSMAPAALADWLSVKAPPVMVTTLLLPELSTAPPPPPTEVTWLPEKVVSARVTSPPWLRMAPPKPPALLWERMELRMVNFSALLTAPPWKLLPWARVMLLISTLMR